MKEMDYRELIDALAENNDLTDEGFAALIECDDESATQYLYGSARKVREEHYGKDVYVRGLIEFTNYCRNDCRYCGIRRSNGKADRYRLSDEEILSCADAGYELGLRTFVLQGGEDSAFTDDRLAGIISAVKEKHGDCAITLSIGERTKESYKRLFDAGADRYLLRHETADAEHYSMLHPAGMSFDNRIKCLFELKEIGYQVGCGMMIGSPGQKTEHLVKDLRFIQNLQPDMVGMGPFIPHRDTEYSKCAAGSVDMTQRLLAIVRLVLPRVLLPATTALGTLDPNGREKGLMAGSNVLMPNLSPASVRKKYSLYDNKICTGDEAASCIECLRARVVKTGYRVVTGRGDPAK